jgi:CheY-like chemotaxis protein
MNRILLIEDDSDKREKISSFVQSVVSYKIELIEAESLRSGWKAILRDGRFDLILLDMSMPGFDSETEKGGGDPESFAGSEIMAQMSLRGIVIPVIVVTQYNTFDNGAVSLDELVKSFYASYPEFFIGYIYYNSALDSWKSELERFIQMVEN